MYGTSIKQTVCPDPVWKPVTVVWALEVSLPHSPSPYPSPSPSPSPSLPLSLSPSLPLVLSPRSLSLSHNRVFKEHPGSLLEHH